MAAASGDEPVPGKELGPLHGRRLGEFEVRIHDEPRHRAAEHRSNAKAGPL